MSIRRLTLWSTVAVCVALILVGCGDDVSLREAPRSVEYFSRSRDFMNAATVLLNESRTLWGQSIRAFYYAVFTIARAKDLDGLLRDDSSIHDKVWKQTVKGARTFFGQTVRRMRNRWDYDVKEDELPVVEEDLRVLLSNGPAACGHLFRDAREAVDRQHRKCPRMELQLCEACTGLPVPTCLRVAALEQLGELETMTATYFERVRSRVAGSSDIYPLASTSSHGATPRVE